MLRYVLLLFSGTPLLLAGSFTIGLLLALKAGFAGIPLALVLTSWFFKYCFIVLDAVVAGDETLPVLSIEMVNPVDEQRPLAFALLVAAQVMLAITLVKHVGLWAAVLFGGVLAALLPATIAVLGITRNAFQAVWPPALLALVKGLGRDYALLLIAMLISAGLVYGLGLAGAPTWSALFIMQMLFLLMAVFVGGAVFEHRLELGVETRTRSERKHERDAREHQQERHHMLDRAYARFRVRKPQEGWLEIETWLRVHAQGDAQLREYRALLEAASSWDDVRAADRLASDLVTLLLAKRATGEALDVVERRFATHPQFQLSQPAQTVRLAELAGLAGKRSLQRRLTTQSLD